MQLYTIIMNGTLSASTFTYDPSTHRTTRYISQIAKLSLLHIIYNTTEYKVLPHTQGDKNKITFLNL